ncbi:MAG: glycine zipper domain-containing protein [Fusobacteriaceae bacterium]
MKTKIAMLILLALTLIGCSNSTAYERRGAFGGAAVGALAGQLVGGSTKSTLIGAGIGAIAGGAIARNKQRNHYRGW